MGLNHCTEKLLQIQCFLTGSQLQLRRDVYTATCAQTEVCAANTGSFANPNTWYIFLDGQSMRINDKPKYELSKEQSSS